MNDRYHGDEPEIEAERKYWHDRWQNGIEYNSEEDESNYEEQV